MPKKKLTEDVIDSICEGIEKGNYVSTICKRLKITEQVYYKWLKEAETKSPQSLQYKLKQRVQAAEAVSELNAVEAWVNQFETDWRAPKEFLARRHSDKWGNQPTEVQLTGGDKALPVTFIMDTPQIEPNIKLLDEHEAS
tara:strand:+ start:325 stop:744 length:420 start_codon:yes stop_codon:yes gene_type:complete